MKNRYEKTAKNVATLNECGVKEKIKMTLEDLHRLFLSKKDLFANPIIPDGYEYVEGYWNTGFVIRKANDGSEFVWIPVASLKSNGTQDGKCFNSKFGRRNFMEDNFSKTEFNEELSDELLEQESSICKYGGFYISRFEISKNEYGYPVSVKNATPWVNVGLIKALNEASFVETNIQVASSHLPYGAEYDCVMEWLIETEAITYDELTKNSSMYGNYSGNLFYNAKISKTGNKQAWAINNISDIAGNVQEWTQEQYGKKMYVVRGGNYARSGRAYPIATREQVYFGVRAKNIGFRTVLCIK